MSEDMKLNSTTDIRLIQKMLNGAIENKAVFMPITVNVQISSNGNESNQDKKTAQIENQVASLKDSFWQVIERLPEPKTEYLMVLLKQLCFERLGSHAKIAAFLGLSEKTVHQWRKGSFVSPDILKINL